MLVRRYLGPISILALTIGNLGVVTRSLHSPLRLTDLTDTRFHCERTNGQGPLGQDQRLPREQLLQFRNSDGGVIVATTPQEWLLRRQEIRRGTEAILGQLPGPQKKCELDMKVQEEVDCGAYIRQLIVYSSETGSRVPAYLCIPKRLLTRNGTDREYVAGNAKNRVAAVLCLHETDEQFGLESVVGLGHNPNMSYASELAERGYVTLAPSYPMLANYQPDLVALGWKSGTLKAVWDNMRGVDLLQQLPFVETNSIAAIGHSLGGHNAVFTAFFDERIKVVVSNCGLDSFLDYYDGNESVWEAGRGWTQGRYMPRLAAYRGRLNEIPFDFHELVGGLAPRKVLLIAPLRDENFRAASVDRVASAARQVYEVYGSPDNLKVLHPACGHDFPGEMRTRAYEWIDASFFPNSK